MTMQLLGPWVTTTRYTNKKRKNKSEQQLQAEREHDAWLRKRGLAPDQLKEVLPHNAKGKRVGVYEIPTYKTETNSLPLAIALHQLQASARQMCILVMKLQASV